LLDSLLQENNFGLSKMSHRDRDRGSMAGSANTAPLGSSRRPLGGVSGGGASSLLTPSYMSGAVVKQEDAGSLKRPAAAERESRPTEKGSESRDERRKKRKSRWETETAKTCIPGMPTMIPAGLTKDQEEAYLLQLRIEDASRKLRSGDLGIPPNPDDRSPSPEPVYSSDGKRMNTREYRKRKELEEQRHEAIQKMLLLNPEYKSPMDYRAPMIKVSDKVMIPQDHHPEINFMGLIIGPRGNTLKSLEKETGAKIIIRGKGSVKDGKVGRNNGPLPGENEPLHAYLTSTDPECVKKAVNRVKQIIQEGIERPEGSNELRKIQLRELALLNGTLREDGLVRCTNCGADNHKSWQCQDKDNVTNSIMCTTCGGAGHIASDCKGRRPGAAPFEKPNANKIDREYMSLMAELGEGPPPPPPSNGSGGGRPSMGGGRVSKFDQPPQALMGPGSSLLGQGPPGPPGVHSGVGDMGRRDDRRDDRGGQDRRRDDRGGSDRGGSDRGGPDRGGWNNDRRPNNNPMGQQAPPPWANQGPPNNWGGPGGPGGPGPNWNNGPNNQRGGGGGPPPGMGGWNNGPQNNGPPQGFNQGPRGFGGPPPPPPPGGKGGPQGGPPGNWGMQQGGMGGFGPVPPPPRGVPAPMPFWAPQGQQWGGNNQNPLSGILGAPPPPPPPS